ncbi:MAG: hypothetical protein H6834_05095 [Planctomycetes bacterium]|nr:hypothetical protein [Planctomycetota bacterium]
MTSPGHEESATATDESLLLERHARLLDRLREAYGRLERRAQRIENELEHANDELARKVAELDRTSRHLQSILDALDVGIVVADAHGSITRENPAARSILGRSLVHGIDAPAFLEDLERSHGGQDAPRPYQHPVQGRRHLRHGRSIVRDAAGRALGTVHLVADETEACMLREKLGRQETLVALGEMAAEIAHEIRNPLNAVEGFAHLLRRRMTQATDADASSVRWSERIVDGVREVDAIISNLMSFAGSDTLRKESLNLTAVVVNAMEVATRGMTEEQRNRYGFTLDLVEKNSRMEGDRIKLRQVFRNLFANAIEAMPEGGRVRVRGRLESAEGVYRVTVEDEGEGIDPAFVPRLFRPFTTAKEGGTGLGLALVHRIVTAHGGTIEYVPKDAGACFALGLPAHVREGVPSS